MSVVLHALLGALLDALLWPVSELWPELQAGALGLPAALLALAVHRASADQPAIARAKDRMKGHLLELRLFGDDLRGLLRAQVLFLRHNAVYLGRSLVPVALLAAPFLLLLAQVETRFGWTALPPGRSTLLTADVDAVGRLADLPLQLDAPGLRIESGPLRIEQTRQLVWRLAADPAPGERRIDLRVADRPVALRALVGSAGATRVAPAVYRVDQPRVWLAPGAPPLGPDSPLSRVELAYPRHGTAWLGLSRASWIFTASTLVFAFALRRPLGVEL